VQPFANVAIKRKPVFVDQHGDLPGRYGREAQLLVLGCRLNDFARLRP
jgi:hypothetical protein